MGDDEADGRSVDGETNVLRRELEHLRNDQLQAAMQSA